MRTLKELRHVRVADMTPEEKELCVKAAFRKLDKECQSGAFREIVKLDAERWAAERAAWKAGR